MACRVRYLNSEGIHPREIVGVTALAAAMPAHWLFYASFQCLPKNQDPIEIDIMLVMDDRVLLLELKDLHGELTVNGDQWLLGGKRPRRSPVDGMNLKAKRVSTFLSRTVQGWTSAQHVDARVVLTGTATKANLSLEERAFVLSLDEACCLGDVAARAKMLSPATLTLKKPVEFEVELDRVVRNPRLVRPQEALWGGYRAVDTDLVVHPRGLWREHAGEGVRDARHKSLIRIWAFNKLDAPLNTRDRRRLLAERESRAIGRLQALDSKLVPAGVLMCIGEDPEEILTQHFDLRRLPAGWVTLDKYLEQHAEDLGAEARKVMATTLVTSVAELHAKGIAHRDLGPRCIWVGTETRQALTGFIACQMVDETSVGDWLDVLRGYGTELETGLPPKTADVRALARLVLQIFSGGVAGDPAEAIDALPLEFAALLDWLRRALGLGDAPGFSDAVEAEAEFGRQLDLDAQADVDQVLLDSHETDVIPYVRWPAARNLVQTSDRHVYETQDAQTGDLLVAKVWFHWKRGGPLTSELALMRLLRGVARLQQAQRDDLPRIVACGLSGVGTFIVSKVETGKDWGDAEPADIPTTLRRCRALLTAVGALHDLEIDHGDISPSNVRVRDDASVVLLDIFDYSGVGDGKVRSPGYRPNNAELLHPRELDRYAVLRLCEDALHPFEDERLGALRGFLASEMANARIELLEPLLRQIESAEAAFQPSVVPTFVLHVPGQLARRFEPSGGPLYVRKFPAGADGVEYVLYGPTEELRLVCRGEQTIVQIGRTPFSSYAMASERGTEVKLTLMITTRADDVPRGLIAFLDPLVTLDQAPATSAQGTVTATTSGKRPLDDIASYWRQLLVLEEEHQPTVVITAELSTIDPLSSYGYERQGADFDFDPEDQVEVRLQSDSRRVGDLSLEHTDGRTLVVRHRGRRRLRIGDRVILIDRKTRTSFDRRQKAVNRILGGNAAVPGLINYFSPEAEVAATDYGLEIPEEELARYGLNKGQEAAFRHVLRFGPVALQQGPPGTGKTRFIAALVHWLVTRRHAGRILVASQSHEAVNNAIEALVDLYRGLGGVRPSLLRIGSKGVTDKIRPFHTSALREKYQVRFEAAFKHRVAGLASAAGIRRAFALAAVDLDRTLGEPVRRVAALIRAEQATSEQPTAPERRRRQATFDLAMHTAREAASAVLGLVDDTAPPEELLANAFEALRTAHPGVSPGDLRKMKELLELGREWAASLASSHRNFDEFLAKTRTVVTATCVGVGQTQIRIDTKVFDWVIIDEAARCTSSELAVPIQVGQRVLLVGDHLQLKPMIDQQVLDDLTQDFPMIDPADLRRSDFERAFTSKYGKENGRTFDEQYRMTSEICNLVSDVFYRPHAVELRTSKDRTPNPAFAELKGPLATPATWVDTQFAANRDDDTVAWNPATYWNPAEVDATLAVLERIAREPDLVTALAQEEEQTPIGVICMYSGQRVMMEQAFAERPWESRFRRLVRIETVDAYQGKENTIVILSLVRSNPLLTRGHVNSWNRCNVAVSRAKERLFIVGDRQMWAATPRTEPMRQVLAYFESARDGTRFLSPKELS